MNAHTCWLTINRSCNLRCEWCYAQESHYQQTENMDFELAKKLIDISIGNNISHFIIIGGEPTIHPQLFEILNYIEENKSEATIVTNGVRLSDIKFCEQLAHYTCSISISLKGSSNSYYKEHCGSAVFDKVLQGLKNCKAKEIPYSLSYVLSADNITEVEQFAKDIKAHNINDTISFSFCNGVIQSTVNFSEIYNTLHPLEVDKIFSEKYNNLHGILNGNLSLHQTLPLCMCNSKVFSTMKERGQVTTSCHVHNRKGLIFDTNGSILLCNHFIGYGIGTFGTDFYDATSLAQFWDSPQMKKLHSMLTTMPSEHCVECDLQNNCGGGCCIQWFSHNFNNFLEIKNKITNN